MNNETNTGATVRSAKRLMLLTDYSGSDNITAVDILADAKVRMGALPVEPIGNALILGDSGPVLVKDVVTGVDAHGFTVKSSVGLGYKDVVARVVMMHVTRRFGRVSGRTGEFLGSVCVTFSRELNDAETASLKTFLTT